MRQIVLDFSLEKDSISKEYKTGILSFFKNCLSQSNEEFFNEMYDKQFIKERIFVFQFISRE